jgi:DNA polymerase-3 subunit epsilon
MSETPELQGAQTAHLGASWAEDVFAAFDLETTGLDVRTDEIVQVAFVLVMPDGTLHPDSWSTIVNPGRDIPDGAIAVHGITSARAIAEGIPATEAHHMILDRFDSAAAQGIPVVIYNVPFDIGFMHVRAQRLNRTLPSALLIDPLVCDRALDKYRPGSRKLIDMAAHYGCATEQLHDVRFDCIASVAVMRALITRYDRLSGAALQELQLMQADWYRAWAVDYQSYLERDGTPSPIDPGWPIPDHLLKTAAPEPSSGRPIPTPWWEFW